MNRRTNELIYYVNALELLKIEKNVTVGRFAIKNKPSFCSGSCDEIHAATKLKNKISLKDS